MKRFLLFLTLSTAVLCASASNRYISPTGNDGDGKSWANAKTTIGAAKWDVGVGDTMFIAEGVYNEQIPVQDGATYLGGYNAETGERDIEQYQTIIDGTDIDNYLIVRYLGDGESYPTHPSLIEGFTLQNLVNSKWGGGAIFLRGNMTVSRCQFINCKGTNDDAGAGAIFIEKDVAPQPPHVIDCVFELCEGLKAAAIYNNGPGIIENCIFRGCSGTRAVLRNYNAEGQVRNCVIYNNAITGSSSKVLENNGTAINMTICNNYSDEYASYTGGSAKMYNCVMWGNQSASGFASEPNYISSSSTSGYNVADHGSSSSKFISVSLAADNNAATGPNFRNPTGFVGVPKTDVEIEAMRNADFSLTDASTALLDKGDATVAPATDVDGVVRPKGNGIDIGAYEFDPNAEVIAVTGVSIVPTSIEIIEGRTGTLMAQVEPANANNKRVTWSIDNEAIATIKNGVVTGVKEGTTTARVKTQDGEYTAAATVIITPRPPVKYPQEVLDAEATYKIEDYTIPSFIPFLVAKQEAKIDSASPDVTPEMIESIAGKLEVMNAAIKKLQPKEMPYNQIATVYGDPATHMGFCWFTNGGIKEGKVQLIAKADATAEDFETCDCLIMLNAQTTDATLHYTPIQASESPKYDICTAAGLPRNTKFKYVSHKAQATELTPGTTYSWRVGYDGNWSEIAQFVTKDENQGDFSFVYMTDSHIQDAEYIEQARQCAEALVKNEKDVKFCIFPGDFVDTGGETNSEWQWERWFEGSMRPMLNAMTVVPTDGNHDDSPSLNYDYHFNTDWGFANAAETKPQFKGITYSFVYGDVLFLVYSLQDWWRASGSSDKQMVSSYLSKDVRNWFLDQVAKYPNTKYRVTLSHKNVFSGAGHHTDDECPLIRELMLPILKECEIDLAIQGHDHCYEVMGPVNPDTRMVIENAIENVERVAPEETSRWGRKENKTGLEGGTFTTNDGTLYFIGATCGRKRYEPYNRATMEEEYTTDPSILFDYKHHNVKDLFDLFTSKFGQPGSPSYTRFNVTGEGIEMVTYKTDEAGNKEVYNTIHVKRTKPHTVPQGLEDVNVEMNVRDGEKFIRNGQLFIKKDGKIYNVIGQKVAQ
jgi:uncharacterized protein YjdB